MKAKNRVSWQSGGRSMKVVPTGQTKSNFLKNCSFRMGVIKHFFVVNARGNPVALRSFLEQPSQELVEQFFQNVSATPPPPPVFRFDSLNYAYVKSANMYFVLATSDVMSPTLLLELLTKIILVISDYIGKCTEISMQKNLALVYEIIDEVISFGCPQHTDSSHLLHLVNNTVPYDTNILVEFLQTEIFPGTGFERPLAVAIDQRSKTNNEVFVMLEEKTDLVVSPTQQVLSCIVSGICTTKSFLQGQPSVLLQLDPQMTVATRTMPKNLLLKYDDIVFAPHVQTTSFDSDRSITFAPPDGTSTVFTYRTTRPVNPPFMMSHVFENKQAKVVVVRVALQSTFAGTITAQNIVVKFQCPVEISNATCEIPSSVKDSQSTEFDTKNRQIIWRISKFQGQTEMSARFRFIFDDCIPAAAETILGPIGIEYFIPGMLPSGLTMKNFMVSTTGTSNDPRRWYKEATIAGSYTFSLI